MTSPWGTIIVAAGGGSRFGGGIPKQYAPLAGRPVLAWSLETLANQGPVAVVVDPEHANLYEPILRAFPQVTAVLGGSTRQDSVREGLKALKGNAPKHILIHDAARPLVGADSIARLKAEVEAGAPSATLAVPVADTLAKDGAVIDRDGVHAIQTPQAFDFKLALEAHEKAKAGYTDDTSLVKAEKGVAAALVAGSAENFKITTADDLARAEKIILAGFADTRTGIGFDVHRFGDAPRGGTIRLFGCDIASPKELVGHSDADAGLHAIADAILGTIGAGDIGVLFPPTDPQWKGLDSAVIVQKALALLHAKRGTVCHVDIMLMAEFPRIGEYREIITRRLCTLLNLPADAVGLKATTTEQMGFIGRGEGLAVQAIATVRIRK